MSRKGVGGHQSASSGTCEWFTPPEIIRELGPFDLDPCTGIVRPWDTAKVHYTKEDNGLVKEWFGRVWCNPPYGDHMVPWLAKNASYRNSIALIFARTDRPDVHRYVFEAADSILYLEGRIWFYTPDGKRAKANGGAPNILIAYGKENAERLADSNIKGHLDRVRFATMIVVGFSPSWKSVISMAITYLDGQAEVSAIYEVVKEIAPDKVRNNENFKEKIRQQLRFHFSRIKRGYYTNEQ
jgi:hypothetical protein